MPIAAYPATLPCPQTLTSTLAESRLLSEQPAQQARAISKERLAVVSLSWTLTDVQAATFVDWFDDDIEFGGSWFTATWPTPEGLLLTRSYRFSGRLAWNFIPGGFWTVSAVCEVQRPYVPPPPPSDPYFASVGLLLHCDVQNLDSGLYYLVDASSAARTCRSTGPAGQSIDTTIKKFGAGSVKNTSGNLLILVGGPPPSGSSHRRFYCRAMELCSRRGDEWRRLHFLLCAGGCPSRFHVLAPAGIYSTFYSTARCQ